MLLSFTGHHIYIYIYICECVCVCVCVCMLNLLYRVTQDSTVTDAREVISTSPYRSRLCFFFFLFFLLAQLILTIKSASCSFNLQLVIKSKTPFVCRCSALIGCCLDRGSTPYISIFNIISTLNWEMAAGMLVMLPPPPPPAAASLSHLFSFFFFFCAHHVFLSFPIGC